MTALTEFYIKANSAALQVALHQQFAVKYVSFVPDWILAHFQ